MKIPFRTNRREEAVDITQWVQEAVARSGVKEGFVIIYVPHETAAVSIHSVLSEGEVPKWQEMLEALKASREAGERTKAAFVAPTEVGVVEEGRMLLGPDQRIFFYEFDGPKDRVIYVYVGG